MRRHHGGDLVAGTPGGHEQDPFRPAEPEARPVGLPGERADLVPQRSPDVGFGPPRRGEETLMLLAEHDRQVGDAAQLVLPQRAVEKEQPSQVLDDQLGDVAARVGEDRAHRGSHGDRALLGPQPAFGVQRHPGGALLVLGEAERVAVRGGEHAAVELVRDGPEHVADDEPQRPADRRVRPEARSHAPLPGLHADLITHRAVDDDQLRGAGQRRRHRVGDRFIVQQGSHRGQRDRRVLRQAPGHDGVDRHVLGGDDDVPGRHGADDVPRGHAARVEERRDPRRFRGDDRQAVGPPALVIILDRRDVVTVF